MKTVSEASLYVLRRKDTKEYFKRTKSSYLKDWKADDPRRQSWTPKLELASIYPLSGVKSIRGQELNFQRYMKSQHGYVPFEMEIVRVRIVEDGVVEP